MATRQDLGRRTVDAQHYVVEAAPLVLNLAVNLADDGGGGRGGARRPTARLDPNYAAPSVTQPALCTDLDTLPALVV